MPNLIPTMHQAGVYELSSPFVPTPDTIYECSALVNFATLDKKGTNVYQVYYEANGLPKSVYEADAKTGVVIVTIKAVGFPSITLPSSYIKSLPSATLVPFNLFILSASITVPDSTDFATLTETMQKAVSANFGISDARIDITQVPTRSYMTTEDAKISESNRMANITDHDTLQTENLRLNTLVAALNEQLDALTGVLIP